MMYGDAIKSLAAIEEGTEDPALLAVIHQVGVIIKELADCQVAMSSLGERLNALEEER